MGPHAIHTVPVRLAVVEVHKRVTHTIMQGVVWAAAVAAVATIAQHMLVTAMIQDQQPPHRQHDHERPLHRIIKTITMTTAAAAATDPDPEVVGEWAPPIQMHFLFIFFFCFIVVPIFWRIRVLFFSFPFYIISVCLFFFFPLIICVQTSFKVSLKMNENSKLFGISAAWFSAVLCD